MKILNTMLGRQAIAAALVLSLAIPMSVGAFAEEPAAAAAADDTVVAGYLPPQDESVMLQGEIALHSGDVAVGETDPAYGGYGAPEGDPIQGDIMLISADEAKTTEARYTVKGLLGRQVLYTARQEGRVLTLDVPDCAATFRTTIQDMKALMEQGVSTLVLTTEKGSTTLNLSLLCEGQTDTSTPLTPTSCRALSSSWLWPLISASTWQRSNPSFAYREAPRRFSRRGASVVAAYGKQRVDIN